MYDLSGLRHALEIAPCISSISTFNDGHAGVTKCDLIRVLSIMLINK